MSADPANAATGSRSKRDPEATRTAILDAAERLFIERGLADTPTSLVAREAGVTKSLIHHHFGSKDALWDEIKQRRFSTYFELQRSMLTGSVGTAGLLRESMIAFFRFLQADAEAVRFMSWRFVDRDDPCLEQEEELYRLGVERIREAQAAGELRSDLEPIAMLKAFLGLCLHWFQSRHLLCQMMEPGSDTAALDETYLETILRLYFDGAHPR